MIFFYVLVLRISEVTMESCLVEWQACRPISGDSILYILQLQRTGASEQDFIEVRKFLLNLLLCN